MLLKEESVEIIPALQTFVATESYDCQEFVISTDNIPVYEVCQTSDTIDESESYTVCELQEVYQHRESHVKEHIEHIETEHFDFLFSKLL